MRDCNVCEFFCGYDNSDGTPICDIDGGFKNCPYNDCENERKEEVKGKTQIVVDLECITRYVKDTIVNTFEQSALCIAKEEIEKIVKEKYEQVIKAFTEESIQRLVQKQIEEYMDAEISVGGGWCEPLRMITRKQFLTETVEKKLAGLTSESKLIEFAKKAAQENFESFARTVKNDINRGITKNFDEVMRKTLTDSVVNMLMQSETYQGLSKATQNLLK